MILRAGLTQDGEATIGVSILADAVHELDALAGIVDGTVSAEHIVPLLLGLSRRLNAALRILRAERRGAS